MKCFHRQFLTVLFLALVGIGGLSAQEIQVRDAQTGELLGDVAIYNLDRSATAITDEQGRARLDAFQRRERVFFRHLGYEALELTKMAIVRNGGQVNMNPKRQQLQEVIMSVSKWEQQRREVPQRIETVTQRDVLLANPQTSADLLQQTGKVFVQKSQYGGGSPMIRGFATNRVLLSVDGVRMNNAIFRGGNLQNVISIDPLTVRKTEILFGPGSVIYGSDAIGGVMNFYTKNPRTSEGDSIQAGGNLLLRTASAAGELTLHAEAEVGWEQWATLTSVTLNHFGDLLMGSHGPEEYLRPRYILTSNGIDRVLQNPNPRRQVPSGYEQTSLMHKWVYRPSRKWSFDLGLHYSATSDYPRYDRLIRPGNNEAGLRSAEWYYGPQKWFMGLLRARQQGGATFYEGLKVGAAYQFFEESRNDRNFGDNILYRTREQVDAYSLNLDLETRKMGDLRLYYGLEYIGNRVHSTGSQRDIDTGVAQASASRYPDGARWQSAAGYMNATYRAKPNLTLMSGMRYNHVWIRAAFDDAFYDFPFQDANLDNGALTGSLGLSWFPVQNTQVTLNGSTGFRAPNIDDIGKIFDSEPGSVVVPNPDLEPEYAYNAELGLRQNLGDRLILRGTAYYTYLVDALVRRDFTLNGERTIDYNGEPSNVQAIQNAAKAYVYGFEFGMDATLSDHLMLVGNLTLTEGVEEDDDGNDSPSRHVAPTFADLHLKWNRYPWKWDFFLNYNGEIPYRDLAFSERSKTFIYLQDTGGNPYSPSWYTLNLRGSYTFSAFLELTVALENLTDQRYRPYSSGIAAPGFNAVASMRLRF
ncbi:TonB-dependent receptor [Robiginitalea sp. M366]|uniref:TonB-dependent receptor plug domain-containing protein n=1 Tax=Robiginitalea aestuariiviva TaxID=3036903 RepID=UPI00240D1E6E|nr:TonB-dependent receptor [Robiginitalea aestuariiviva]MDG1571659.1 TonB-dependent receptor [Robiginitalea aestuariiviva]